MSAKVTLTVVRGKFDGKEFEFTDRTLCTIGRSSQCYLQLPSEPELLDVSRQHCLLDIDPPFVGVRDLGSLNGTYVNGRKIGQRRQPQTADEAIEANRLECPLQEGDEITVGHTVFRVKISQGEQLADNGTEMAVDEGSFVAQV